MVKLLWLKILFLFVWLVLFGGLFFACNRKSFIQEEQEFASKLTQNQIEYYNQCALEYADKMMSNY